MLRELRTSNARLLLQAEYNEERIKIYKSQITALEEKDRNYNLIICRHEQTIMHLKYEVLVAQDKLYKTEKSLENSKRNKEETLNVTMTNEDLGVGNKESMEVAGSNDQDTSRPIKNSENNKNNRSGEQIDITKSTEEVQSQKKEKTVDPVDTRQAIELQDVVLGNNVVGKTLETIIKKEENVDIAASK
jgi:nucleoprotein TPR